MKTFLVAALSTIALGTLLIAYGLLAPQLSAATAGAAPTSQAGYVIAAPVTSQTSPTAVRTTDARVTSVARTAHMARRTSERDWTKTLLVVGGSTAAGAGLGGIVGGGKGAAIGAAIGGGASTLFEALRK